MKKTNTFYLAVLLIFIPSILLANKWNNPDKGWFTGQTKIDKLNSSENKAMGTVSFEGKVFYFSNLQSGGNGKISLRKLSNNGAIGTISWTQTETIGMANLNDLGKFDWQPAPVVFNDILYLFVGNKSNGISYSAYNAGDSSWSTLVDLPGDFSNEGGRKLGFGMAAAVVGNRLCLVAQNYWGFIQIFTTTDTTAELTNWTYFHDSGHTGVNSSSGSANSTYGPISAISQIYTENGTRKSKLKYAYIDGNKHPHTVECSFDTTGWNYTEISDQVISTETKYQSVALIEGTVTGDPGSAGHCVQAFLKLNSKDNGYCRYRIQRWQSKEGGSWTKQENNLVKQNYLWARKYNNLCAVNFGVADGNDIRQFMCLIYCGYNDWDWPLNCAWAETDRLVWDPDHAMSQALAGAENTQYVGYIEGPPPFHVNDSTLTDPYITPTKLPISEIGYESSETQSTEVEMSYDVSGKVSFKAGCFKAGLNAAFKQVWGSDFETTKTQTFAIEGKPENKGTYLTLCPVISRAQYFVTDVHGTCIDTTFYFTMSDAKTNLENVELQQGLDPGNPATYVNRPGINFNSFETLSFGSSSVSWNGNAGSGAGIEIKQSNKKTNTISGKLNLGAELGEMFDVGFDGSIDYSMETTTSVGTKINATTRLNEAVDSNDVVQLNYDVHWINPLFGYNINNWWLHDSALTQNTWCVTYHVTKVEYMNGNTYVSEPNPDPGEPISEETEGIPDSGAEEQLSPTQFSLAQNYPNPFKPHTVIKYQIGIEDLQAGIENQGYQTKLAVYNLSGHQVALVVDEWKASGSYEVEFDASQLTPGVYFYSLQSGSFRDVKKLILLK